MPIYMHKSGIAEAGALSYKNLDPGTTGAMVFTTAGAVFDYYIRNNATSIRYVKFYDKVSAATHTDTPIRVIGIPATAAANLSIAEGIQFRSGCCIRVTTGVADNDASAPSTNDVVINIGYR